LRVLYTNADQLPNKLTELKSRIEIEKPHILVITEVNNKYTRTSPDLVIFNIEGYQLYHQNVSSNGRGIIIYVHHSIQDTIEIAAETEFSECKLISMKLDSNTDFLIATIYRSDSGTNVNNENLLRLLKEINGMKQSHKLIVGDFNYKHIDWDTWSTSKNETSDEQAFINCIQDLYWYQHVTTPTRYRAGEEPSTLDLVFTNEESMLEHISYQSPLGKSDHSVLFLKLPIKQTSKFMSKTVYKYEKGDYLSMRRDLNIDWQTELNSPTQDVTKQWETIKKKVEKSVSTHVPSYQTTEKDLWKKGKVPLKPETRKEIRKNTDAGREHMRQNKTTK
jgi:exonuclease III